MSYYLESLSWNVAGQEIWPVLSSLNENQLIRGFKQDFERAWTAIEHDSPRDCLETAINYYREQGGCLPLVLSEDARRILLIENQQAFELYRITKDMES
jgi:hypothetical protein